MICKYCLLTPFWPTFSKFFLFCFNSSIVICLQISLFIHSLLLIVSELNGQSVSNAAKGGRLHLPVVNWVAIEANAIIEAPLHAKTPRTEVINIHSTYVVGMKVEHLQVLHVWQTHGDAGQPVVFQMQLPEIRDV